MIENNIIGILIRLMEISEGYSNGRTGLNKSPIVRLADVKTDSPDYVEHELRTLFHGLDYEFMRKVEAIIMAGMDIRYNLYVPEDLTDLTALTRYYQIPTVEEGGSTCGACDYILMHFPIHDSIKAYLNRAGISY